MAGGSATPPRWLLPPVVALFWLVAGLLAGHRLTPMRLVPWRWAWLGLVVAALGLPLVIGAATLFRRRGTTVHPHGAPTVLVTEGPFRFTRNPMYLSLTLLLTGIAVLDGRALAFAAPVAFLLSVNGLFVPREERVLGETFGAAYEDYRRRVRRWL